MASFKWKDHSPVNKRSPQKGIKAAKIEKDELRQKGKLRSLSRMYLGKHKHRLKLKRKTLLRISMLAKILRPELAYIH